MIEISLKYREGMIIGKMDEVGDYDHCFRI